MAALYLLSNRGKPDQGKRSGPGPAPAKPREGGRVEPTLSEILARDVQQQAGEGIKARKVAQYTHSQLLQQGAITAVTKLLLGLIERAAQRLPLIQHLPQQAGGSGAHSSTLILKIMHGRRCSVVGRVGTVGGGH